MRTGATDRLTHIIIEIHMFELQSLYSRLESIPVIERQHFSDPHLFRRVFFGGMNLIKIQYFRIL